MPGLNQWMGMGYLGKDPELKYIESGAAVANFSIGITKQWKTKSGEERKETTWVAIEVWQKQAENVAKYCAKGSLVLIEGELQVKKWETDDGEKKSRTVVRARRVTFLSKSQKQQEEQAAPAPDENEGSQEPDFGGEDDVPF